MERNLPRLHVTEKAERALKGGHPWVFADEVTAKEGDLANGCLADVFRKKTAFWARAFTTNTPRSACG